ncbi:MAG: transglutaminase domain-containing protein [Planctomycetota bacterium]|nr:transglutaminase domain-containing protein [Planctomycetota bacterium]
MKLANFILILTGIFPLVAWGDDEPVRHRRFDFSYAASANGIPQGANVRIWIPVAESNSSQRVRMKSLTLPCEGKLSRDSKYGNRILFLEKKQEGNGPLAFRLIYDVGRSEAVTSPGRTPEPPEQLEVFLQPNTLVPLEGKPIQTFEKYRQQNSLEIPEDGLQSGRLFYDFVEQHMKYDKSKPGYGNGDSVWACDSRTGNCTDFHSLFISVARARGVPAKFQIGFPLPAERGMGKIGGYHCWAQFHSASQGWVPVDISEADKAPEKKDYFFGNLNENRIQFTTGRDIVLSPPQKGPPLNYFVYPHVEVDGKTWPKDRIRLSFGYRDH